MRIAENIGHGLAFEDYIDHSHGAVKKCGHSHGKKKFTQN